MHIHFKGVRKEFESPSGPLAIIENLTYEFPEKTSCAILGNSGVGKSTFLYLLAGLDSVSQGEVWLGDFCMSAASDDERSAFRAKHIGFVFQFHHLLSECTALENTLLASRILGAENAQAREHALYLLERVGLTDRLHHRPHQLSGGERQRVALARALASRPSLLIADEPTGSLDEASAQGVRELLFGLARESEVSMIVVTHNKDFAAGFQQRLEMHPGGALEAIL
jgi:predicted ABC-type transport system involved in lysophospholipase L1 biosynthesis ATPase subunit